MRKIFAVCLLLVIALSACRLVTPESIDFPPWPLATVVPVEATESPTVSLTPVSGGGYPEVVFKAREMLASDMGFSAEKIEVINVEPVD